MIKQLLVIRPGAIGDTLLALPILQALKAQENLHITLIGNAAVLPLARACGVVDEVFDYQDARWARLFLPHAFEHVQDEIIQRSTHVICWLHDPEGVVEHNLRVAGVPQVTVVPGRPKGDEPVHATEYLARTIDLDWTFAQQQHNARLVVSGRVPPLAIEGRPFAIHPGSGGERKCWPVERFVAVIQELWRREIPVLILAGPAEQDRLVKVHTLPGKPPHPNLLRLLIDIPLIEVAGYLLNCRGYLGNDSGLTHLAALLGVPTIALFGASDPRVWHPLGSAVKIVHRESLTDISVGNVIADLPLL